MAIDLVSMILANDYTEESLLGGGAVVGKNVTISSITPIEGGNKVTFSYTLDNGTVKTSSMNVMDGIDGLPGKDGVGISKIEKIGTVDLVDTYRITFTDNSTFDYEVTNGTDGYTPVKGTDYWTTEDKAEIQSYIDSQIGGVLNGSY